MHENGNKAQLTAYFFKAPGMTAFAHGSKSKRISVEETFSLPNGDVAKLHK